MNNVAPLRHDVVNVPLNILCDLEAA
jgi:hypothetical protein